MMTNKLRIGFAAALLALTSAAAWAGPAKKKAAKPAAPAAEEAAPQESSLGEAKGVDKKRFEFYLKERLKKIKDSHQLRLDFFAKEQSIWTSFWSKVRDDRQQFEIRITRQTLDLFESLASLDPKDYPLTIQNFEKLQGDVIKSFETQQKAKMADFFASREARWKEFAADQEKERADFVADANQGWQDNKASLKNPDAAAAAAAAVPDDSSSADDAKDDDAPKAKTKSPASEKRAKPADDSDKWH